MTNDQTVTQALEPCPFCGGDKARTIHIRDGRKVACPCGACGKPEFHGPLDKPDADVRAITAWNTRTAHSGEGRSNGAGEIEAGLVERFRSALRFAASHSVISSADEQALLAALAHPEAGGE